MWQYLNVLKNKYIKTKTCHVLGRLSQQDMNIKKLKIKFGSIASYLFLVSNPDVFIIAKQ